MNSIFLICISQSCSRLSFAVNPIKLIDKSPLHFIPCCYKMNRLIFGKLISSYPSKRIWKILKFMIICIFSNIPLVSYRICITRSSLSWYFNSWMHKTLPSTTTISGFTFITIVAIVGCWVDKVFVLNKSKLGVVPNSFFLVICHYFHHRSKFSLIFCQLATLVFEAALLLSPNQLSQMHWQYFLVYSIATYLIL
jgi:hypothetical protein